MLQTLTIPAFTTLSGVSLGPFPLSYELFGKPLFEAPLILVNHALTANSTLTGEQGWWSEIVGPEKAIDTNKTAVLCFNIPGNGYDNFFFEDHIQLTATDVALIFLQGLEQLGIQSVDLFIGGSVGGGIAWSMLTQNRIDFRHFVPIATDWKSTDWIIAHCHIQERLLQENSDWGLKLARQLAMLSYRSPQSFDARFQRERRSSKYAVESWLDYHGDALSVRFHAKAYRHLNQILRQINAVPDGESFAMRLAPLNTRYYVVTISSDLLFIPAEDDKTVEQLKALGKKVDHFKIYSPHGHDAFLIEHSQVAAVIKGVCNHIEGLAAL